jgi:Protein kinase domain
MSAGTEPARWSEPRAGSQGATLAWLDALSSGACTPEAFLSAMRDQFQGDSEEGWEVLSLLDQYYRRGKIKAELFQTLKTRLESSALMVDEDMAARQRSSAPVQRKVTPVARPPVRDAPTGAIREAAAAASREAASGAAREVAVGDVLRNRYRVRAVIGHGGMGTVFEATDEYRLTLAAAGQRLALKVLHTAITRREEVLIELQREFQHLQLLSHPNIVRVHEFDRDGDIAFFTMELLNGAPLSGVLSVRNATALPRPYAFAIMRDVGAAISYAHSHGVVHGDINPQNIFVTNDGDLRVLDFGASNKLLRGRWLPDNQSSDPDPGPVATPGYASCQLLEGQKPDARDDLFAFACVAYVLLSGRHPFPNRTALEARAQRLRPRCPPGLGAPQWRVLREGLRWERDRRPSDVQKWLRRFNLAGAAARLPALPVLVNAPPPRGPRGLLATAAVTLLALLLAGGIWAMTDYESFQSHVAGWRGGVRSALETAATAPPRGSQPAATPSAPPAREAIPAPQTARDATAPLPVSRAAPAPRPAPSAAPIAAPPPASASAHTAAAPARVVPGEAVARAANAGPMRIEMAADTVDIQPGETTANVVVHRKGNLHGETSFTWWTESGTAKPGRDFAAAVPRAEHFEDGSKSVILNIPVSASPRTQPMSFYVVIDRTDAGAALGERNLTMVTLQPDG